MRRSKTQYHHVSFIQPVLNGLIDAGVNTERLIASSLIRYFDLSSQDNHLPIEVVHDFLSTARRDQGIDSIAETFYPYQAMSSWGTLGDLLQESPNFGWLLTTAAKYISITDVSVLFEIEVDGPTTSVTLGGYDPRSPGGQDADKLLFTQLLKVFDLTDAQSDHLLKVSMPEHSEGKVEDLIPGSKNTEYLGDYFTVQFKTDLLASKPRGVVFAEGDDAMPQIDRGASDALKIERVLMSCQAGYVPTQTEMANFFGVSERTIRRILCNEHTTYQEVLDRVRFQKCLALLADPSETVNAISEALDYNHSTNFLRAFKRWTGCSPTVYRERMMELS